MAYKRGLEGTGPVILEPVMAVEVSRPRSISAELIADFWAGPEGWRRWRTGRAARQ